jgi:hypothetical protein
MSTYTSEPGTRLAGRYRLVDQMAAGSGWTMWKAVDETLARSVSVLTFAPGFPRVPEVVTAARAASRLTDPRLSQVFDVEDGDDQAYVVMEWVSGQTLTELVAEGPLDPARACALIGEAARALAGAHAAGQAHLCLTPQSLRWTRNSGVKITGLGIDAALAGAALANASDPALTDTRGLAGLLYAALTGCWPGEDQTALPPAPRTDGEACTPRQASPGVPTALDAVITRALLQRTVRHEPPILTPDAFAEAIASVAPPVPLPDPAPAPPVPRGPFDPYDSPRGGYGPRDVRYPGPGYPKQGGQDGYGSRGPRPAGPAGPPARQPRPGYQRPPRGGASRAVITVVVVLVIVAVAAGAYAIAGALGKSGSPGTGQAGQNPGAAGSGTKKKPAKTAPAVTALTPQGAKSFNILGDAPTPEDPQYADDPLAGHSGPAWSTQQYQGPDPAHFGNLKNGDGYLIEMGTDIRLSSLAVTFADGSARARICIGNQATTTTSGTDMTSLCPEGFRQVAPAQAISGQTTFHVTGGDAAGRDILIWFTRLTSAGTESISKVTVYGSDAANAG